MVRIDERFWSKVDRSGECWVWTGAKSKGYGIFCALGRTAVRAHRVSWWLEHGALPTAHVLHKCDNPSCVRPAHLFLGTDLDNARDRAAKRRGVHGSSHPRAKLSESDVRWMRWARAYAGATYVALAKAFGLSYKNTRLAVLGHTWRHV